MSIYAIDPDFTLWHGEALNVLATLPEASVDLVVTDPPYGVTSLGWDQRVESWPAAVARVLKPTGSLWCFGSFRFFFEQGAEAFKGWRYAQEIVWEKHNGSNFHADRFRRVHELVVQFYRHEWEQVWKSPVVTNDAVRRTIKRRKQRPTHPRGGGVSGFETAAAREADAGRACRLARGLRGRFLRLASTALPGSAENVYASPRSFGAGAGTRTRKASDASGLKDRRVSHFRHTGSATAAGSFAGGSVLDAQTTFVTRRSSPRASKRSTVRPRPSAISTVYTSTSGCAETTVPTAPLGWPAIERASSTTASSGILTTAISVLSVANGIGFAGVRREELRSCLWVYFPVGVDVIRAPGGTFKLVAEVVEANRRLTGHTDVGDAPCLTAAREAAVFQGARNQGRDTPT